MLQSVWSGIFGDQRCKVNSVDKKPSAQGSAAPPCRVLKGPMIGLAVALNGGPGLRRTQVDLSAGRFFPTVTNRQPMKILVSHCAP